jgi:hypothetical protein
MVMFSMQDVIRIMTLNTATFLNLQNDIGSLAPKKRADIVLVQGNPFQDFNDLLNVMVVLKDGKIVVDKRTTPGSFDESGGAPDGSSRSALVGTLTASMARPDQPPVTSCAQLGRLRLPQADVQSAKDIPASSISVPASTAYDAPAHEEAVSARCEVNVQLRAGHGAAGNLRLSLPSDGWNANILVADDGDEGSTAALARGYAVASIRSGTPPSGGQPPKRGINQAPLRIHTAIVSAKELVAAYYGGSPRYSYWQGRCSEVDPGLAEVQSYPSDFDGVVVGAPEGGGAACGDALDLTAFAARGGKIIEYHGGAAKSAPSHNAVEAYNSLAQRGGGIQETKTFYRLFLLPEGQGGDSYRVNWTVALDEWVQRGRAPDIVLADHSPPAGTPAAPALRGVVFEPPFGVHSVCAYPMVAQPTGGLGKETPVDYICVSASRSAEVSGARP